LTIHTTLEIAHYPRLGFQCQAVPQAWSRPIALFLDQIGGSFQKVNSPKPSKTGLKVRNDPVDHLGPFYESQKITGSTAVLWSAKLRGVAPGQIRGAFG